MTVTMQDIMVVFELVPGLPVVTTNKAHAIAEALNTRAAQKVAAVGLPELTTELYEIGQIVQRIVDATPIYRSQDLRKNGRPFDLKDAQGAARIALDRLVALADAVEPLVAGLQARVAELHDQLVRAAATVGNLKKKLNTAQQVTKHD